MTTQHTQPAVDVVLDAPASVAIYLVALQRAGRVREAGSMLQAHGSAVHAAVEMLAEHALWTATAMPDAPRPHSYDWGDSEVVQTVEHASTLADAPSLHTHVLVGRGALDRDSLRRALPYVRRRYERRLADDLAETLGLALRDSPYGLLVQGMSLKIVERFEKTTCRLYPAVGQHRAPLPSS